MITGLCPYFPKDTDLSAHDVEELEAVVQTLNTRPGKMLGGKQSLRHWKIDETPDKAPRTLPRHDVQRGAVE